MAMVLDAFASYIADTIKQMAADEVGMLLGVTGEIDSLQDKLESLRDYLADAERKRITDRRVQGWVTKLKGIMYEATNILDLCELKAMDRRDAAPPSCCNPLLFCLRHPRFAHDIGSRIRKLNKSLDDICKLGADFSFIKLETYQDHRTSRPSAADRKTDPVLERSAVVGEKIEEDTRALVEELTKDNDGIKVVAIVGVGGIGKTTLAKKVFNEDEIKHNFEKKMWLSVTQDFSKVELLRSAISAADGKLPATQDKSMLVPALLNAVRNQKFLLVLDDMWSDRAWTSLLNAPFSHGAPGSRIVITTRNDMVARGMRAREPYHRIDKLGPEDAWLLLRKQVVSGDEDGHDIDMLKDIGLQVVEKCDGLPLAVKVMGGLLCQKGKQRHDWEMVLNDSIWTVSEMPEELNYAVYLSYEDLPPRLKQCFLYYSLLPKGGLFSRAEIIGMWISEGFIHGALDDLEELGRKYYSELILRNLIEQPGIQYIDNPVFNMHDVVRSFAQFVARDEAIAVQSGENGNISELTAQKFLHLSIESKVSESEGLNWSSLQAQRALRTLICVGHVNIKPGDLSVAFPCLRTLILHIDSANVALLVESLHELKHLRYLSIRNSDISCLPDNIGKMKFLQYMSLGGCQQFVKLPDSIVNLGKLWSLDFRGTRINGIPRGFCSLNKLRTLYRFPAQVDGDWCSLEELGPLSQLRVLDLAGLQNVSAACSAAKARLSEKVHLTNLYLYCTSKLWVDGLIKDEEGVSEQRQIKEVFDELCPPPTLDLLIMKGYFGRQLPRWMTSTLIASSLRCLRIVWMEGLVCCSQLPAGLCQLPYLERIKIVNAPSIKHVGPEFLQPYNHHGAQPFQVAHAFPRLRSMELIRMPQWASSGRSSPVSDQEIAILNQVWKNKSIAPRVKTFAWRLIRRALASGFRASRYSMHIKKECCRCGQLETDSHLFFHCNFARSVWFNFGLKTDALDTSFYPSAIICLILSAQHLDLNIASIFTILWNIWKARNDFLFKQRTWTPLQVVYATRAMLNAGLMEKSEEDSRASMVTHPKNKLPCKNLSLQPAGILAYVDAAFNPAVAGNEASFGVFLRNEDNNHSIFIQAMAWNVFSVLQAEAMGLLLAASTVKTLGWSSISFLSDCRTLVDAAEARNLLENPGHWRIRPILAEFFNIASCLNSYKVTHIPRIKNLIAHSLAKKAFLHRSSSCCSFLCSKAFRCNLKMAYDAISFPLGKLLSVYCLGC